MTVHLLTIGDEILIGQIVDTNTAWMSQELTLNGIRVAGKSSVGDTQEAILAGLTQAAANAEVVIMTGGLGPTKDDITKKTLAELFNSALVFHPESYQRIEDYFTRIGKVVPPAMRDQATLPDQAVIMTNKTGTAPGMWFERNDKIYIALPGVPWEMEYLMRHEVVPRLLARFPARPIVHRTLQTVGEGESNIARRIEAFENSLPSNIKLAYLPALGQVRLRLSGTWEGPLTKDCQQQLEDLMEAKKTELAALLPDLIFGYEDETLQEVIGNLLQAQGKQFGSAESCTGGHVAHLITLVPRASQHFIGAVVTYSNEMKIKLLGVKETTIKQFGAVSEETVREMALGALDTLQADVSLSISGIAGPDGGTPDKPVGTVWMAVADQQRVVAQKYIFQAEPGQNIQLSAIYGLNMVRKFLLEEG